MKYYNLISNSKYIVCSFFRELIDVYDVDDKKFLCQLNTKFEFGGNRLSISRTGDYLACAGYNNGISLHHLSNGEKLWHKSKIKSIQSIFISTSSLVVHTERNKLFILNIANGDEVALIDNVYDIYITQIENCFLIRTKKELKMACINNGVFLDDFVVKNLDYNDIHFVTFYDGKLLVSCSFDILKAFSSNSILIWESNLPKGFLINSFFSGISEREIHFFAGFNSGTHFDNYFISANIDSGVITRKLVLPKEVVSIAYNDSKREIICSDGTLFSLNNIELTTKFY